MAGRCLPKKVVQPQPWARQGFWANFAGVWGGLVLGALRVDG